MAKIDSRSTGDATLVVGWYDVLPFGSFTPPSVKAITTSEVIVSFGDEAYATARLIGAFDPVANTGVVKSLQVPFGGIATEINVSLQDFLNPSGWGSAANSEKFQRNLLAGADTIWGTGGEVSLGTQNQNIYSDYIEAYGGDDSIVYQPRSRKCEVGSVK